MKGKFKILKTGTQFCDCQHKEASTNFRQIMYTVTGQQFSLGGGGTKKFNM
jgi:hypothetical protein